jgi:hypothetical protein
MINPTANDDSLAPFFRRRLVRRWVFGSIWFVLNVHRARIVDTYGACFTNDSSRGLKLNDFDWKSVTRAITISRAQNRWSRHPCSKRVVNVSRDDGFRKADVENTLPRLL